METVRRNYLEDHRGIMTADLVPKNGQLPLPPGPGLGIDLDPEMFTRPDVTVERIGAS
jgi:L-alanine-DL-glutamate epimerase-like enolase superfamily enzyme